MDDSHIPINVMGVCFGERRLVGKPSGRLEECCRFSTDTVLEGSSKKQRGWRPKIREGTAQAS